MKLNSIVNVQWRVKWRVSLSTEYYCAHAAPQVPCFFIFGDSLADNGNNNNLATVAKANYHPFGIGFLNQSTTGRFTNGRTTVDVIGELLGLDKIIPSFATARGRDILIGVNYASGGAGIRDETGKQLINLLNHSNLIESSRNLIFLLKPNLNHMGDDYLNNYFVPGYYNTSRLYTPEQFAKVLIVQYYKQLKVQIY
uniref:SGNH hydrolase-type esterase domain-containing protein n=1 Tax=Populus trichocarpa TaxID=3694 RepID=A0A2K1R7R0_POPTR